MNNLEGKICNSKQIILPYLQFQKIQILSVSLKVLLDQAVPAVCLMRKYRFYLLASKVCLSIPYLLLEEKIRILSVSI